MGGDPGFVNENISNTVGNLSPLNTYRKSHRFLYRLSMRFTPNVKKMKGATHKNGDVDGT